MMPGHLAPDQRHRHVRFATLGIDGHLWHHPAMEDEPPYLTVASRRSALLMPSSGIHMVRMGMRTFCMGPIHCTHSAVRGWKTTFRMQLRQKAALIINWKVRRMHLCHAGSSAAGGFGSFSCSTPNQRNAHGCITSSPMKVT